MIKNNLTAQNSFIMDETLETVPEGKEVVTLKILKRHHDGDSIELEDDVKIAAPVSDNEIAVLESMAIDLMDLENTIINKGMSQGIALEMMRYCPDIINDERSKNYFTMMPSNTGLKIALEEIDSQKKSLLERIKSTIAKIIAWLVEKYEYYKNKILPGKKKLEEEIKQVNKMGGSDDNVTCDALKKAAAKKYSLAEQLDDIKEMNHKLYVKQCFEELYLKSRKDGDGLEEISILYNVSEFKDTLKIFFKKLSTLQFRPNAFKGTEVTNKIEVMSNMVDEMTSILGSTSFRNMDSLELQYVLKENVYKKDYLSDIMSIDHIDSRLSHLKRYQTEDPEEIALIKEYSILLLHSMAFAKKIYHAVKEFKVYFKNYIDPTSDTAIDNFFRAASKKTESAT